MPDISEEVANINPVKETRWTNKDPLYEGICETGFFWLDNFFLLLSQLQLAVLRRN